MRKCYIGSCKCTYVYTSSKNMICFFYFFLFAWNFKVWRIPIRHRRLLPPHKRASDHLRDKDEETKQKKKTSVTTFIGANYQAIKQIHVPMFACIVPSTMATYIDDSCCTKRGAFCWSFCVAKLMLVLAKAFTREHLDGASLFPRSWLFLLAKAFLPPIT